MSDNILDDHRRALSDYRIALGLDLRSRRSCAGYSYKNLASRTNIPAETLRSYEKGASLPQLVRLADIGKVYSVTMFDILDSTAEYIYRASGEPSPNHDGTSVGKISLHAVVLYCGVTPAQLRTMEVHSRRRDPISEDLFGE